jgi:hypothetical protein
MESERCESRDKGIMVVNLIVQKEKRKKKKKG